MEIITTTKEGGPARYVKMYCPIKIKLYNNDINFLPTKAHDTDAAFDLRARAICISPKLKDEIELIKQNVKIKPKATCLIKTGVFIGLPEDFEMQIRPRSGLALKKNIIILNSPGTIDSGYRNEVGVILYNLSEQDFEIKYLDRIAQAVIQRIPPVSFEIVDRLEKTDRNLNGFGSSGV